jgi:hypothetical protein
MAYQAQMIELAQARERLIARCAEQRAELSLQVQQWQVPLALADRAWTGVRFLRAHPVFVAAVAGVLLALRARNVWHWLKRGFVLWRTVRALSGPGAKWSSLLSRFAAR